MLPFYLGFLVSLHSYFSFEFDLLSLFKPFAPNHLAGRGSSAVISKLLFLLDSRGSPVRAVSGTLMVGVCSTRRNSPVIRFQLIQMNGPESSIPLNIRLIHEHQ